MAHLTAPAVFKEDLYTKARFVRLQLSAEAAKFSAADAQVSPIPDVPAALNRDLVSSM